VRQTIVVRGAEAMAPRDPLPLHLPEQEADEDADAAQGADGPEGVELELDEDAGAVRYADLDPFERGPEITEVR
jgi:hypothetical protein